jgi:hypothetical protein
MKKCKSCHHNPVRVRNGKDIPGWLVLCMKCAEKHDRLQEGDSEPEPEGLPEPEGFTEFLRVVTGGPI